MRVCLRRKITRTRGTILVLSAILLIAFMGFVALAVDVGVGAAARAQLQTVADAAALAGARQLASDRRLSTTITDLAPEMAAARAYARAVGQSNYVLRTQATINDNPGNSTTGDIVIGFIDPADSSSNFSTTVPQTKFNSVQVTATRSSDHGGVVPAFFSKVLGSTGSTISVTSTATVGLSQIKVFNSNLGSNAHILPIALDQTTYNAMLAGPTSNHTDQYTFNPTTYNPPASIGVTSGPDGVKESQMFPVSTGSPGNWGTISFDGKDGGGAAALKTEISNGVTPAEIQSNFPLPNMFYAKPGINSSIKDDLTAIIGEAVAVPIYDTDNGANGANLQYNVVAIASARIVAVNFQGSNKYVIVQPAINMDPTAIPFSGPPSSDWSNGGVIVVYLSRFSR